MDNLDPDSYAALLAKLPLATSRFVAISKSGGTGETLMQITAALAAVKAAGLAVRIPDLFLGLTEPAKGGKRIGLRVLCDEYEIAMLEHDPGVGGRFSVLTNVGLLPAAAARPRHRRDPRRRGHGAGAGAGEARACRRARRRRRRAVDRASRSPSP